MPWQSQARCVGSSDRPEVELTVVDFQIPLLGARLLGARLRRFALRLRLPITALWLMAMTTACGAAPTVAEPRDEAENAYLIGLEQMHSGNPLEAAQTFAALLKLPAYLAVTATARLRLGDALFAQSKYQEAIEAYQGYVRRHEGTADVAYAAFRLAQCHAEMAPTDSWLLPPVHEMDLSAADKARYHLERFVRAYPTSVFVAEALRLRDGLIDLELAQHRYVIGFYIGRKQWLGAIYRSHEMMRRFPLEAHERPDYVRLADAYAQLGWRMRAKELYTVISHRWAGDAAAAEASANAARLRGEIAKRKAAGEANAEMPPEPPPSADVKPENFGQERSAG
jgi:outer membrane protein assembly factor BamD